MWSYVGVIPIVLKASFVPVEPDVFGISLRLSSGQHVIMLESVGRVKYTIPKRSAHHQFWQ